MLSFIRRRFLQSIVVIFIVTAVAFTLLRLAPGSPAILLIPPDMLTAEAIAEKEAEMGLDRPVVVQFVEYLGNLVRLDFGDSLVYKQPVLRIILQRLPHTIRLGIATIILAIVLAVPLGIFAGANRGKILETFCMVFALLGQSMSSMWLGVLCIFLFAVKLGWLPAIGTGGLKYMIMPVFTMGYPMAATLTRVARSGMVDTLSEDYITATYAKGMSKFKVYTKYALRNALIPVSTMIGINLGASLGGAVVVEQVFSWTGIGQLMNQSIGTRDYLMVQTVLLIIAFSFTFINFMVDIINSFIDPRLSLN